MPSTQNTQIMITKKKNKSKSHRQQPGVVPKKCVLSDYIYYFAVTYF